MASERVEVRALKLKVAEALSRDVGRELPAWARKTSINSRWPSAIR